MAVVRNSRWQAITHEGYANVPIIIDPILIDPTVPYELLVATTPDPPQRTRKTMKKKALRAMLADAIDQLDEVEPESEPWPHREQLVTELEAARTRAIQAEARTRLVEADVEMMRKHWRPVPLAHVWEPRDYRCSLCDDPRDSPRHTPTPLPGSLSMSNNTLRVALAVLDSDLLDDWSMAIDVDTVRKAADDIRRFLTQVDGVSA